MEKLAISLQREAMGLKKIRDNLLSNVDHIRLAHPCLTPVAVLEDELSTPALTTTTNPWESAAGLEFLESIRTYKRTKGGGRRYPQLVGQLSLSEEAVQFAGRVTNAFIVGCQQIREEAQASKRRRTDA